MIVIGSYAAALNGIQLRDSIEDIDAYGSKAELKTFRAENAALIVSERVVHGDRTHFTIEGAGSISRVEFGIASRSDIMLERLSLATSGPVLNSTMHYPSPNLLYLIKRSHGFGLTKFEKTSRDLVALKPFVTPFSSDELAFLAARTRETEARLRDHRPRFRVPVTDDVLLSPTPVPVYAHTEVLGVVAFEPGVPVRARLEASWRGRSIEPAEFATLSPDEQLKLVQEEVMANAIERFHLFRPQFPAARVYSLALFKTARDLLSRPLQEFYLDHLERLIEVPPVPFIERFQAAVSAGAIQPVVKPLPVLSQKHKAAWELLAKGASRAAGAMAEDMVRFSEMPGDPYSLHILGVALIKQGKNEPAERCLRKSLAILPDNSRCAADLAGLQRAKAPAG